MSKFYNRIKWFVICIYLIAANRSYSQCSSCTLTGWQYQKEITIDNSAISVSHVNFQEPLIIDTQTQISQGKMNVSGNDIRFIDSDCNTPLCYWIESGINTTTTKIWVMLPSLPANTIKTFFMFYGNTSATATSNFACVFPNVFTVTGAVTLSGNQNYDWIEIQPGGTVNIGSGQILSFKARKIIMAGAINGDFAGNGPAAGPGAGGNGGGSDGGGGGGYGGTGGSGKCPGGGSGAANGTANGLDIDMGSGGGGSDCNASGGGGGAVKLEAAAADITGNISVNGYTTGGSCFQEAAGGGSGGGILIYANEVNGNGTLSANGGNGQASGPKEGGGGGAGGRIKLFYCTANNFTGATNVNKGSPGAGGQCSADDAQNGTATVNTFVCEAITVGPEQNSVFQTPTSTFTAPAVICAAVDSSVVYTGNAITGATYAWNFDGGVASPGTGQGPHTVHWLSSGTKNITLTVTSADGCISTASTVSVTVNSLPISNAGTAVSYCSGDSAAIGTPVTAGYTYLWSPGNGLSSPTVSDPTANLTNPSTGIITANYTVTTTNNGCSSTDVVAVTVFPIPVASFVSPAGQCFNGNSLSFSAGGSFLPNPNFLWTFGTNASPATSALQNPSGIVFSTLGSQTITLQITQNNCASNTYTDSVNLYPMPLAGFSFADVCLHQAVNFNDLSTVPGDTVFGWAWNFANGSPLVFTQNPIYTYTISSTYPVTLIVATNKGCKDTATQNVTVHPLPNVQFSAANVCDGDSAQFVDLSGIPLPDGIQSRTWNFGDGSPLITLTGFQTLSGVLYTVVGSYAVQLSATSTFGCRDSITKTIIVHPNPVVKFTADDDTVGCEPICVAFQDSSSFLNSFNLQLTWNVGDNSPVSHQQNFEYCYTNPSVDSNAYYTVTLMAASDSGCVTTKSKNNYITVYPHPNADFSIDPQTTPLTNPVISTTNSSAGAVFWNWNFGDSATSALQYPPSHTYTDTGTYIVTLIVSTQYGCIDTAYQTITIEPEFVFYIPNAFSPDGDGINDNFTGKGIFIKQFEMTIFDRWGNLIFFSDDINLPWDGRANHGSETSQQDVYVYAIKVTDVKSKKHVYRGVATLMR